MDNTIIRDLFAKDINRSINGVVKVQDSKDGSIRQELDEYVVTRELQRHFATFFKAYGDAIDARTDKIGVWISGFFGSGKSHFLKMLSYLLENRQIGGKSAIRYFDGKIVDPMVAAAMERACSVPTQAILFNIDSKAGQWKQGDTAPTALLRGFERMFYEARGFYGEDLKLAKLEDYIDSLGKTQEFREAFERVNGESWLQARDTYSYFEDDVVEVLQSVLGMAKRPHGTGSRVLRTRFWPPMSLPKRSRITWTLRQRPTVATSVCSLWSTRWVSLLQTTRTQALC